jgi:hypothetical protein
VDTARKVGDVELRQLRYFVAVSEELNFGRAAAREHIVQSALSQQVQRLERELGVRLLERTTHYVALTRRGRRSWSRLGRSSVTWSVPPRWPGVIGRGDRFSMYRRYPGRPREVGAAIGIMRRFQH